MLNYKNLTFDNIIYWLHGLIYEYHLLQCIVDYSFHYNYLTQIPIHHEIFN
jgi:hypothetical protein